MQNPGLGQSWRNLVATDLDQACRLWCQVENSRKRPRSSDRFISYNVLQGGIPDWYSNPRGLTQFLVNNPPQSESEDEDDFTNGLPRFGLMKHLKHTVVVPPNALGAFLRHQPQIADYKGSPGSPRKRDFCESWESWIRRRECLNAEDHHPSSNSSSSSASGTKNKMSVFSQHGSWTKSTSNIGRKN